MKDYICSVAVGFLIYILGITGGILIGYEATVDHHCTRSAK